jgi:uncharacterized protein with GYD domain
MALRHLFPLFAFIGAPVNLIVRTGSRPGQYPVSRHLNPRFRSLIMPKYLTVASYTAEGAKGLLKEGGTARRAAVEKLMKSLGGRLEAFYFAFGDNDAYIITEGPDNVTIAAVSLSVTASGAVRGKTIVLLTPEEIDQAAKKTVKFRPPGS